LPWRSHLHVVVCAGYKRQRRIVIFWTRQICFLFIFISSFSWLFTRQRRLKWLLLLLIIIVIVILPLVHVRLLPIIPVVPLLVLLWGVVHLAWRLLIVIYLLVVCIHLFCSIAAFILFRLLVLHPLLSSSGPIKLTRAIGLPILLRIPHYIY